MQTQMPVMLPESVNFKRQVELNRKFEGDYRLADFPRLKEVLLSDEGLVHANIEFGHSVGYACLRANVSAQLMVKCQRCLQAMELDVSGGFKFALIHDEEEAELLPEEFEPYLLEGEEQSMIDLIEDELLLSIPMVTMHQEACSSFMTKQNEEIKAEIRAEREAANPFAVLKDLKN